MNEPDFTQIIAARQREKQEQAAAAAAEQLRYAAEKRRKMALVEETLTGLVGPILEKAAADLEAAGLPSEIGNGRDQYKSLRLSLRVGHSRDSLVFTACESVVPYLGHHIESEGMGFTGLPKTIQEPDQKKVVDIISEFLLKM